MTQFPLPLPPSMAAFPKIYADLEIPGVETMVNRAIIAKGTCYEKWAYEAMVTRAVLEQAINLNRIAQYIQQDAFEASELASHGRANTHPVLSDLNRALVLHAVDVFAREHMHKRKEDARRRRAEKKAEASKATAA